MVERPLSILPDILIPGIAAILLPLLSFRQARLAPVEAIGPFPVRGVRRAGGGRSELGRSRASLHGLLPTLLLAALRTFAGGWTGRTEAGPAPYRQHARTGPAFRPR